MPHNKKLLCEINVFIMSVLLIDSSDSLSKVQIYNLREKDYEDVFAYVDYVQPDYEYSRGEWLSKKAFVEIHPSGGGDGNWYIKTEQVSHNTISYVLLFMGI